MTQTPSSLIGKHGSFPGGYGTIVGYHHNTLIVDMAQGGTENVYLFGNWREVSKEVFDGCSGI